MTWETIKINPDETGKIIFATFIQVNEQSNKKVGFASSSAKISADKTQLIQSKVVEIMDILNDEGGV